MLAGRDLREIAAKMANLGFDDLADAGVLRRGSDGKPSLGGSDWHRFNTDPLMFILKLPDDRRDILAAMVSPYRTVPKPSMEYINVSDFEGEEW